jgi:uncharacterized membrane protein YczE
MKVHWGFVLVVLVIGYFIGAWMPGFGKSIYAKVGM